MKKEKVKTLVAIALSIILWAVSMAIVKKDIDFTYRWVALALHYLSFIPVTFLFAYEYLKNRSWVNLFRKGTLLPFLFVLLVAAISYFIFLERYPFVSRGDELRDCGLRSLEINEGEIRNIFGYGDYNGYGLDSSILAAFFYRLFGSSVLTYRFPSAILAVIEVIVIYVLGYLILGQTLAFWSAIVLIALPLQLMLARTELLVLFNSFLTSAILLFFYILKDKKIINFALFGIVLGFSSGFHTAVRAVALVMLFAGILFLTFPINTRNLKEKLITFMVLILFCFIGFGPRLIFTTKDIFFAKHRFYAQPVGQQNVIDKIEIFSQRYYSSFLSWFVEPLQNRTVDNKPILTPILSVFFIVGLVSSLFWWGNLYLRVISLLALVLPFTNSALTDTLNQGHRLSVLLPIGAILVAFGIIIFRQKIPSKLIGGIFSFLALVYLLFQIFFFFYGQPINKSRELSDYLSMHLVYFLKTHLKTVNQKICLKVSPKNWQTLDLLHFKEQYEYFFPDVKFSRISDISLKDNEVYIFNGNCHENSVLSAEVLGKRLFRIACSNNTFFCPPAYLGDFKIYY